MPNPSARTCPVGGSRRRRRGCPGRSGPLLALLLAAAACGGGGPALPAPPAPEVAVREDLSRVLDLVGIEGLLGQRDRAFTRQVAIQMLDPTDRELERLVPAVLDGFAYDSLRADVLERLAAEARPELVSNLRQWMDAGATAAVRRIAEEYDPPLTLEQYANEMTDEPPPEAQIHLMGEWAEAQGRGDLFVLMQEALREASFLVHGTLRPNAPEFEPLTGAELEAARASSHAAAVITLLHRHERVPEPLIQRSIAEYRTESGVWFTRNFPLAVAEAIRAAGERVAATLADDPAR